MPGYVSAVGDRWDTVTYFIGSLFFTAASFLSYREAVDAAPEALNPAHRRLLAFQPGRIDWWATAVQLLGTLYFNVSTGVAVAADLSAQPRTSMYGGPTRSARSASWSPAPWPGTRSATAGPPGGPGRGPGGSRWLNLIGSIAFGISAVAGYINPVTGQVHNAGRANTQTLIGAVCFLIGAILLLPERTEETHRQATAPTGSYRSGLSACQAGRFY